MLKKITLLLVVLFSITAHAQKYESLKQLRQKVLHFAHQQLKSNFASNDFELEINQFDQRLRLKKCTGDKLKIYVPHNKAITQSSTIAIKCYGPHFWSLFIPIDIKVYKQMIATNKYLPKNHVIKKEDVKMVKRDSVDLQQGYFTTINDVVGKITKKVIIKNRIISPVSVKLAKLIDKGDIVQLTAAGDAIKVTVKGIAMQSGRLGENISVKNLTSKKIIEAQVIGNKEVLIKM